MHNHSEWAEKRALAAVRAAMASVSVYHHATISGQLSQTEIERESIRAMAGFTIAELLIPLVTVTLGALELAAQARGETIEAALRQLGLVLAEFDAGQAT